MTLWWLVVAVHAPLANWKGQTLWCLGFLATAPGACLDKKCIGTILGNTTNYLLGQPGWKICQISRENVWMQDECKFGVVTRFHKMVCVISYLVFMMVLMDTIYVFRNNLQSHHGHYHQTLRSTRSIERWNGLARRWNSWWGGWHC